MRISLKFKIIIFVVLLVTIAVNVMGIFARKELSKSISRDTEQIMTLNAQKSVRVLQDVNKKRNSIFWNLLLPFHLSAMKILLWKKKRLSWKQL